MVNDPIADFLTRVRNAIQRNKKTIEAPSSKMIEAIAKILKEEGFILDYKVIEQPIQNKIQIDLKYVNGQSSIQSIERISRPGVRQYLGYREIPKVKSGLGISILSTPQGVLSDKQAKSAQGGGEYICKIW